MPELKYNVDRPRLTKEEAIRIMKSPNAEELMAAHRKAVKEALKKKGKKDA